MGIGELREAFNSVSQPAFTCTLALLDYERTENNDPKIHRRYLEWQILRFRGTGADGTPFDVVSQDIGPGADLNQAARETAQRMLDQRKPAS